MPGGLLELSAIGLQDTFLISNPEISFFKVVYKRHTNFSMESIRNTFDGTVDFGKKISCTLSRSGDLVHSIVLEVDVPAITSTRSGSSGAGTISYVNSLGHALIDYVEIEIGGQRIDRHYGEWMEIWSQLTMDESQQFAFQDALSRYSTFTTVASATTVYIPLQFWFCRNIGLALPLVALQYHEVKLIIQLNPLSKVYSFGTLNYYTGSKTGTTVTITSATPEFATSDVGKIIVWADGTEDTISSKTDSTNVEVGTSGTQSSQEFYIKPNDTISQTYSITDARLYVDYIFLDTYERKLFAQKKHNYLIEQIQFSEKQSYAANATNKKFSLEFNLPIKSLYWVTQLDTYTRDNDLFNFSNTMNPNATKSDNVSTAIILFNGIDRFERRNAKYFRLIQPLQGHTRTPNDFIYMYRFCLKPEEHQPTGTCNFSKLDNVDIDLEFINSVGAGSMRTYGINYNILKIRSGMANVAFSS